MRLQLGSTLCLLQAVWVLGSDQLRNIPLIQGVPIVSAQARAARIAEFVSSHKIPDEVQRKDARLFERRADDAEARVDLEDFGRSGRIVHDYDDNRRSSPQLYAHERYSDELLSGARLSSENPTTVLPVLTTSRDTHSFDFVPVNIIREDAKGNPLVPFDNKNFEDLGDVSLVPAGSNTRVQVKKGPNGKDYEYEYVYYYYDEDDEGKASGGSGKETPPRTSAAPTAVVSAPRRGNPNRNKYSTLERTSTTVEPVINEILPSENVNRARHLDSGHDEVSDDRLPTNTRFPPRARPNHVMETTERANRVRGNRQRPQVDAIDSSSFRGPQDGPEFPQNLPNGPVRFLGVTPNEGSDEKASIRGRSRPQRIQEPAPVQESYGDSSFKKRPISGTYNSPEQHERAQSQLRKQPYLSKEEEFGTSVPVNLSPRSLIEERDSYTSAGEITETPTTQVVHAMDKIALDLYAYVQQGRSNLVDFVKDAEDSSEGVVPTTESASESDTTLSSTSESLDDVTSVPPYPTTTPLPSSTPTTTSTTTTSSTSSTLVASFEEPSGQSLARSKIRRPGVGSGSAISRNRFKSNSSVSSSTEASAAVTEQSAASTQKARGRFGSAGGSTGGFKRARPSSSSKPQAEELVEKDSAEVGQKLVSKNRYRVTSARSGSGSQVRSTSAPNLGEKLSSPSSSVPHRSSILNKLPATNRRRGTRPVSSTPSSTLQEAAVSEQTASSASPVQEIIPAEHQRPIAKLPGTGTRPKPLNKPIIKPGAGRLNLRLRPGQQVVTTTEAATIDGASAAESTVDEPASEGTEEETREAPVEPSPAARGTSPSPLNKLRNRNKLAVQPKTTTARSSLPTAARRSHLLPPRRKTTEAPVLPAAASETPATDAPDEAESTEAQPVEVSSSPKPESESRGLSSLLAPRRRIASRKPGQLLANPAARAE